MRACNASAAGQRKSPHRKQQSKEKQEKPEQEVEEREKLGANEQSIN